MFPHQSFDRILVRLNERAGYYERMCDTFVALADAIAQGQHLFAKNSDRHPNEAQEVLMFQGKEHEAKSRLRCSYIEIAQVAKTHTTLLCKPFWCWGAEMGVNEHGLAVGNEATFRKGGGNRGPGLIGLDLVRLALERARDADSALDLVTKLVETNTMGGNAGYGDDLYCDHALLFADATGAWLLEIAGNQWIAERVTSARSVSNRFTTRGRGDRRSSQLIPSAVREGLCQDADDFDFAPQYRDLLYSTFAAGKHRQERTQAVIDKGALTVQGAFAALRDHGGDPDWTPQQGMLGAQVCMHAGAGPVRIAHTTGSLVCHSLGERPLVWVTATSTPCTSIFKPVWLDAGIPDLGQKLGARRSLSSLWWRHEQFQRDVQRDYKIRLASFAAERDAMERDFVARAYQAHHASLEERRAVSEACFAEASEALDRWSAALRPSLRALRPSLHSLSWRARDRRVAI